MRRYIFLVLAPALSLVGCFTPAPRSAPQRAPAKIAPIEMCIDGTGQKVYANVSDRYLESCQSACAKVNPKLGFPALGPDFKVGPDGYCCCYPK